MPVMGIREGGRTGGADCSLRFDIYYINQLEDLHYLYHCQDEDRDHSREEIFVVQLKMIEYITRRVLGIIHGGTSRV